MKYAEEVINLLAAYPERRFKSGQIVGSVAAITRGQTRKAICEGVRRVLIMLESTGKVGSTRKRLKSGETAQYWWRKARKNRLK